MSLHVPTTPEARAALQRQRRTSKAVSFVIAIIGSTVVACVMGLLLIPGQTSCGYYPIPYCPLPEVTCSLPAPKPTLIDRPPRAPSNQLMPLIPANLPAPLSIPVVLPPAMESEQFGLDDDFDQGLGNDNHMGQVSIIPYVSRKRCSKADRLQLLEEGGAATEVDESVIQALRYLKSTQARDGSWGSKHKTAMTGLALLAYLGHCETALSEEFGDSCLRAITYLVDIGMKHDGRLVSDTTARHWPYEQAIGTYALAEAETFHRALAIDIPMLHDTVASAGQLIIDNQHPTGGWDYNYDKSSSRGGDLSITGWQIQALKACKHSRIDFRNLRNCARRAIDYVELRQAPNGGFGYTGTQPADGASVAGLTGVGMLSLQIWDQHAKPAVKNGADYASDHLEFKWESPECDLYAHYYLSQAMFRRGGMDWSTYQTRVLKDLPRHQNADGSWPVPGGGQKPAAVGALFADDSEEGKLYRTTLATLMLEVYYRYLPSMR